jgi:allantoicase
VKPEPPIFVPGKYTSRGKWMDGWESRRRRTPGHDWCIVALGIRGVVHGVNVCTKFFTGNFPSHCSIDALDVTRGRSGGKRGLPHWGKSTPDPFVEILQKTPLTGDSDNFLPIDDRRTWTHLRLNIFPDGGVARLRVYGEADIDWTRVARAARRRPIDLAAIVNGGLVLGASDMHFGVRDNMIMPARAKTMGDGWETRRRRGPGYDWAIVRLGTAGTIVRVEIDTNHFKGNYPDRASLEGCFAPGATLSALASARWTELLPETKLGPHHRHFFARELRAIGPATHVRLNIYPDGGVSRLRIHGTVATA